MSENSALDRKLLETERRHLVSLLRRHNGNVRAVAHELGWGRGRVYRRMDKLGVEPGKYRSKA